MKTFSLFVTFPRSMIWRGEKCLGNDTDVFCIKQYITYLLYDYPRQGGMKTASIS